MLYFDSRPQTFRHLGSMRGSGKEQVSFFFLSNFFFSKQHPMISHITFRWSTGLFYLLLLNRAENFDSLDCVVYYAYSIYSIVVILIMVQETLHDDDPNLYAHNTIDYQNRFEIYLKRFFICSVFPFLISFYSCFERPSKGNFFLFWVNSDCIQLVRNKSTELEQNLSLNHCTINILQPLQSVLFVNFDYVVFETFCFSK